MPCGLGETSWDRASWRFESAAGPWYQERPRKASLHRAHRFATMPVDLTLCFTHMSGLGIERRANVSQSRTATLGIVLRFESVQESNMRTTVRIHPSRVACKTNRRVSDYVLVSIASQLTVSPGVSCIIQGRSE